MMISIPESASPLGSDVISSGSIPSGFFPKEDKRKGVNKKRGTA
jgi:hypothetical protein